MNPNKFNKMTIICVKLELTAILVDKLKLKLLV